MTLRIYGMSRSRAFRTLWLVHELGIPYEHIKTDISEQGTKSAAFRAINPNGHIPAIDEDGFKLWESLAINLYLAKQHVSKGLYPKSPHDEAKTWQWAFWATTEVEAPIGVWGMHTQALPAEKRDPKQAADALAKLAAPFKVLDDHLKAQPYLVGRSFSVADLNLASVMIRCLQMDLKATPKVEAWLKACMERPAALIARKMRDQG